MCGRLDQGLLGGSVALLRELHWPVDRGPGPGVHPLASRPLGCGLVWSGPGVLGHQRGSLWQPGEWVPVAVKIHGHDALPCELLQHRLVS